MRSRSEGVMKCRVICAASVCAAAVLVAGGRPLAQSKARAQNVPEIPYDSVANLFKMPPNIYFGEGIGGATNSSDYLVSGWTPTTSFRRICERRDQAIG